MITKTNMTYNRCYQKKIAPIKKQKGEMLLNNIAENTMPIWQKFLLTPKEASIYTNIGINKIDEMINNPMCNFVLHIGKKRLVKRVDFEKHLTKSFEV